MPQTTQHNPTRTWGTGAAEPGVLIAAPLGRGQCPGCTAWHPAGGVCTTCVTCDRCDTVTPAAHSDATVRGSRICHRCLFRFYWQCGHCDGWNRDGDVCGNHCTGSDHCDCGDCSECDESDTDLVHHYGYKPRPIFRGQGPLFLGPEIEIETPYGGGYRDCARLAAEHLGDLGYLKEDGSLSNGFEIVTHPMSYRWALEHFPWAMLTELADAGCETTEDTGIHVHLSRAGFATTCHAYRWMKFIHRNERHVTRLAGRISGQWAAFTADDRHAAKDYAKGAVSDRYRAINTGNADTFELRVFASSLDPCQVKAILAFAAASVEYTRRLTAHTIVTRGGWDWSGFLSWLDDQPTYWPLRARLGVPSCVC